MNNIVDMLRTCRNRSLVDKNGASIISGVETASHTGHCPINLVNVR